MCPVSSENPEVAGAEVEASMLFADVRGSSKLARQMSSMDFTRLMNRFYTVSREVLVESDAIVEKFVGDEVVGLFLPFLAGQEHAVRAVEAAEALLRATGHGTAEGPWVQLGAGVHTGRAFVGIVGSKGAGGLHRAGRHGEHRGASRGHRRGRGDPHHERGRGRGPRSRGSERRQVSLKGHPLEVLVLEPQPA